MNYRRKKHPVPLVRRFIEATPLDFVRGNPTWHWSPAKLLGWPEIETGLRAVILADPGAGKTFEMKKRAEHSAGLGRATFFVRIEDIGDGFEKAFEVGSAQSFAEWLGSEKEAWFFLDSVDEARLDNPRAFEKAVHHFAERIKSARHRAHIIISSRPYAWDFDSDPATLQRYLPAQEPKEIPDHNLMEGDASPGGEINIEHNKGSPNPEEIEKPKKDWRIYRLEPMDDQQIVMFAAHRDVGNPKVLLEEIKRSRLMDMAGRPFEIEGLIAKWLRDRELGPRYEVVQFIAELWSAEYTSEQSSRKSLSPDRVLDGARILAAAVVLTGVPGIWMPGAEQEKAGVSATTILDQWDPEEIRTLLGRSMFNDEVYGMVRFRQREVRELLAAEWLCQILIRGDEPRRAVESLLFREQYGVGIVTPRLRPLLPWLVLLDRGILRKVMETHPGIAAEGGDAASLPLADRRVLLDKIVHEKVDPSPGPFRYDTEDVARIAKPDLSEDVHELIEKFRNHDRAISFLASLVCQGRMDRCASSMAEIALDPKRDGSIRASATRAVVACGSRQQSLELWRSLNGMQQPIPWFVLGEILLEAQPDGEATALLISSLNLVAPGDVSDHYGLKSILHGFIDRLQVLRSDPETQPLAMLIRGFREFLEHTPQTERLGIRISDEFAWLLPPAEHAVERLVSARVDTALNDNALAIMLISGPMREWYDIDFGDHKNQLGELVPGWVELNDKLFWRGVETLRTERMATKREALTDVWDVSIVSHYWEFDATSFDRVLGFIDRRPLADDKLVALTLAHRIWLKNGSPPEMLASIRSAVRGNQILKDRLEALLNPKVSASTRQFWEQEEERSRQRAAAEKSAIEQRSEWVEALKANPECIRSSGLPPGVFSTDQFHLLKELQENGNRHSWSDSGADWQRLIGEFGVEVAKAYRDAAKKHWRSFVPDLRSEGGDSKSIPYALVFGLVGLEIEAREFENFPDQLSDQELTHALRYLVWEMNGFPTWLERVFRTHREIVVNAVLSEVYWELDNASPDQPLHYILQDIFYHAPWVHDALVDPLLNWAENNRFRTSDTRFNCLSILVSGGVEPVKLADLARQKIKTGDDVPYLPNWYAVLVDADPEAGIPEVEQWLASQPNHEAGDAAQAFFTLLMGSYTRSQDWPTTGRFRQPSHLKDLYLLACRFIRTEDDIDRTGKGVFSPELRDKAQEARSTVFNILCQIPGEEAHAALSDLSREHPDPDYRPRMTEMAFRRAMEDGDLDPWSDSQVREFDRVHVQN